MSALRLDVYALSTHELIEIGEGVHDEGTRAEMLRECEIRNRDAGRISWAVKPVGWFERQE